MKYHLFSTFNDKVFSKFVVLSNQLDDSSLVRNAF